MAMVDLFTGLAGCAASHARVENIRPENNALFNVGRFKIQRPSIISSDHEKNHGAQCSAGHAAICYTDLILASSSIKCKEANTILLFRGCKHLLFLSSIGSQTNVFPTVISNEKMCCRFLTFKNF